MANIRVENKHIGLLQLEIPGRSLPTTLNRGESKDVPLCEYILQKVSDGALVVTEMYGNEARLLEMCESLDINLEKKAFSQTIVEQIMAGAGRKIMEAIKQNLQDQDHEDRGTPPNIDPPAAPAESTPPPPPPAVTTVDASKKETAAAKVAREKPKPIDVSKLPGNDAANGDPVREALQIENDTNTTPE